MSKSKPSDSKKAANLWGANRQSSLQNVINSRYLDPFRVSLRKEILDCLYNGSYIDVFTSISNLHDRGSVSSISIDPYNKFLLHTSTNCEMKLWQIIESELTFNLKGLVHQSSMHPYKHSQWFPTDSGMICYLQPKRISLTETKTFQIIFDEDLGEDNHSHFDWNKNDVHAIAIATSTPTVKLMDIRTGIISNSIIVSGPANTDRQHKGIRNTTRVLWSPLDRTGLFIADSIGDIFFYDTRRLKRPVGQKRADDHRYLLPVTHMEMTPDSTCLMTSHGFCTPTITKWKFGMSGDDILIDSNINYHHTGRRGNAMKKSNHDQFSFFTTMDSIYVPNHGRTGPDLFAYNLQTGDAQPEKCVKNINEVEVRPVERVIGYRKTQFGDDPNPAILYTSLNKVIIAQWPRNSKADEAIAREESGPSETTRQSTTATNHLHEDRWSDSD